MNLSRETNWRGGNQMVGNAVKKFVAQVALAFAPLTRMMSMMIWNCVRYPMGRV